MAVKGWVYVITNKAMPDLVKVGYSMKDPALRAAELNHTGNPHPYDVRYECLVRNPRDVEQATHGRLISYREGKEWFRCDISIAIQEIRYIAANSIFLENTFSGERSLLEQATARIRELEEQNALLQSKEHIFREAIECDDLEWKKCLASYPEWPKELILQLYYNDEKLELTDILAANPSLPPECIDELVQEYPEPEVVSAALTNPNCISKTIAQIIFFSDLKYLDEAKKHPNYSEDVLLDLLNEKALDEDFTLRSWVAEYEICPPETLRKLAGDVILSVRNNVASNIRCPLDCLYMLENDSSESIRKTARENPSHPKNIEKRGDVNHLCEILGNPQTPSVALKDFVSNNNYLFRQAIALNPACPDELLETLANDPEIRVRIAAKHRIKK